MVESTIQYNSSGFEHDDIKQATGASKKYSKGAHSRYNSIDDGMKVQSLMGHNQTNNYQNFMPFQTLEN